MKTIPIIFAFAATRLIFSTAIESKNTAQWTEKVQQVIDMTEPLQFARGNRLPLYTAPTQDPGKLDSETAEYLVSELDRRGIAVVCSWDPKNREESLASALTIARVQQKAGLSINTCAASCTYFLFNGDKGTAHIDEEGNTFFDESIHPNKKDLGCPFALNHRLPVIREAGRFFCGEIQGMKKLPIDFIWTDWEVDGPLDVNHAHDYSRRCVRCRENIPDIDNFTVFSKDHPGNAFVCPVLHIYRTGFSMFSRCARRKLCRIPQ